MILSFLALMITIGWMVSLPKICIHDKVIEKRDGSKICLRCKKKL